jgi:hypothetical protein
VFRPHDDRIGTERRVERRLGEALELGVLPRGHRTRVVPAGDGFQRRRYLGELALVLVSGRAPPRAPALSCVAPFLLLAFGPVALGLLAALARPRPSRTSPLLASVRCAGWITAGALTPYGAGASSRSASWR